MVAANLKENCRRGRLVQPSLLQFATQRRLLNTADMYLYTVRPYRLPAGESIHVTYKSMSSQGRVKAVFVLVI